MAAVDWKSFFFGGGDEQALEFFPTVTYEDSFAVESPPELFNEGISDWKDALVGQFIGTAPNFIALKRTVDALWGKSSLAKHIQHKPLVLRKWEPNLKRLDFDLAKMPVWVQLYNAPLELFSRKGLSYISSALGVPLYMDLITASREHLEFAKCSTFGHSEKFCPLAQQKERDLEWRAKKGNLSIVGVDQVITEAVVLDKSEAANVLMEAETIESTVEVTGYVVEAATDVSPNLKKGRGKSDKHNAPVFASSMNKFEVLNSIDKEGLEPRKTRVASLGVANLLQELKVKKSDKVRAKGPESGCSGGFPFPYDCFFLEC
ncbi:hypothetical protein V6N13_141152 [Hibiscus sabdariffa]